MIAHAAAAGARSGRRPARRGDRLPRLQNIGRAEGQDNVVWQIVILVVIAGGALWYFGNGLVYDYLIK